MSEKSPSVEDSEILAVAIKDLRGQAQYDFLIDYFNSIRIITRNQTLAQVEKIIDEDEKTKVWWEVNPYRIMLRGKIKNLKDNHSSNLGGVAENQIGVSESIRVANSKQSTVPETHSKRDNLSFHDKICGFRHLPDGTSQEVKE